MNIYKESGECWIKYFLFNQFRYNKTSTVFSEKTYKILQFNLYFSFEKKGEIGFPKSCQSIFEEYWRLQVGLASGANDNSSEAHFFATSPKPRWTNALLYLTEFPFRMYFLLYLYLLKFFAMSPKQRWTNALRYLWLSSCTCYYCTYTCTCTCTCCTPLPPHPSQGVNKCCQILQEVEFPFKMCLFLFFIVLVLVNVLLCWCTSRCEQILWDRFWSGKCWRKSSLFKKMWNVMFDHIFKNVMWCLIIFLKMNCDVWSYFSKCNVGNFIYIHVGPRSPTSGDH